MARWRGKWSRSGLERLRLRGKVSACISRSGRRDGIAQEPEFCVRGSKWSGAIHKYLYLPRESGFDGGIPNGGRLVGSPRQHGSGRGQPRHVQPLSGWLRVPQVMLDLLIQPTLRAGVECDGEPNGHLGADARTAVQDGR